MIVLGVVAAAIFVVLGAATFVLILTDVSHSIGQWRRDRIRTRTTLVQPRRWS